MQLLREERTTTETAAGKQASRLLLPLQLLPWVTATRTMIARRTAWKKRQKCRGRFVRERSSQLSQPHFLAAPPSLHSLLVPLLQPSFHHHYSAPDCRSGSILSCPRRHERRKWCRTIHPAASSAPWHPLQSHSQPPLCLACLHLKTLQHSMTPPSPSRQKLPRQKVRASLRGWREAARP